MFVVGGGNSAGQGALYLARFARSVTLLVRGAGLAETMSQYLVERIDEAENIQVRTHVAVSEVHGESSLEAVSVRDLGTGNVERLPARAVFVFIGAAPRTAWLDGALQVDAGGFVLSGVDLGREGASARADGSPSATRSGWRPASPASSSRGTCGTSPPSASPPQWAKGRWPCSSCTSTCAARLPRSARSRPPGPRR